MALTTEEILINKIEAGLRKLKAKKATPLELKLGRVFNRLKPMNPFMYDDLIGQYKVLTQGNAKIV